MSINGFDSSWYDWTGQDGITGGYYYIPIMYDLAIRNGSQFCILKACDGASNTRFYKEAMRDARAAGIPAIPYVWCHGRNRYDPRKQGEHWYNELKDEPSIAVDFERYDDSIPNYDDLYNTVNRMRELGYKGKLILYTNWGYWLSYGSSASVWLELFDGGLWLSDPDDDPPNCPTWASASEKLRKAPTPFPDYVIHQYSFSGDPAKYGVTAPKLTVDENKFTGTPEQFNSIFGGAITPPPPQEKTMKIYRAKVSLNVRNAPSTAATVIGSLPVNGMYSVSDVSLNWGKVVEMFDANGVKISLPAAECWISTKPEYAVLYPFTLPTGGQGLPVITFNLSADGYPAQVVTWTPS